MLVTALMRKDVGKEDVPTTKQTSGYQLRHQGGDASINKHSSRCRHGPQTVGSDGGRAGLCRQVARMFCVVLDVW